VASASVDPGKSDGGVMLHLSLYGVLEEDKRLGSLSGMNGNTISKER
jgi:hypothetical protein